MYLANVRNASRTVPWKTIDPERIRMTCVKHSNTSEGGWCIEHSTVLLVNARIGLDLAISVVHPFGVELSARFRSVCTTDRAL